jgi:hypothetical protein
MRPLYGGKSDMVGARGFEPPAYGTQNRRATRLRYAPFHRRCLQPLVAVEKAKLHLIRRTIPDFSEKPDAASDLRVSDPTYR